MNKTNKTSRFSTRKLTLGVSSLAIGFATVPVVENVLGIQHITYAEEAITNTITGVINAQGKPNGISYNEIKVITKTTQAARAGDYIDYILENVSTGSLDNLSVKGGDGQEIGKLKVIQAAVPEVNKQSSGDLSKQTDTTLKAYEGKVRLTFNKHIEDFPEGTEFTFGVKSTTSPVVYANRDYTLNARISTTTGTTAIEQTIDIPKTQVVAVKPVVGISGIFNFDADQNMTSQTTISVRPQKDVGPGTLIELNLSEASGIEFLPDKILKTQQVVRLGREVTEATPVNENGAYMIAGGNVILEPVEVTKDKFVLRVVSGTIPAFRLINYTVGVDKITVTGDNYRPDNKFFDVPSTTQTIDGEAVDKANLYRIQGAFSSSNTNGKTTFLNEKRKTIKTPIFSSNPQVGEFKIPGYRQVSSELVGNNRVENTYHKLEEKTDSKTIVRTVKFVDEVTGEEIPGQTPIVQSVTLTRTYTVDSVTGEPYNETTGKLYTTDELDKLWNSGEWSSVNAPKIPNYVQNLSNSPDTSAVIVDKSTENVNLVIPYNHEMENVEERKTVTRTINYLEKGTNKVLKDPTVETVTLTRTKTTNKVTNEVTYGEWSKGNWSEVTPGSIANYKAP
ncbi:mucin-binding protein, partial [Gemella haemolysans]|uniref:mucin-binding protein n=1 Tax=Gemella haemolysans TaxID=1379 RepID=UPI003D2F9916